MIILLFSCIISFSLPISLHSPFQFLFLFYCLLLSIVLSIVFSESVDKFGHDRMSDESSKRADSDQLETDQEQSDTVVASSPPKEDKTKG